MTDAERVALYNKLAADAILMGMRVTLDAKEEVNTWFLLEWDNGDPVVKTSDVEALRQFLAGCRAMHDRRKQEAS